MSLREYKKVYDKDGVVVIPNVFTNEEVQKMKSESYLAMRHSEIEMRNGSPAIMFWPSATNTYLRDTMNDHRLSNIVRFFLGDNVKQLNNQVYFRLPGDGDEFAWHQDVRFRTPKEQYPGIESSYLQTIIAIDDITLDNSPVEFILGSHLGGVLEEKELRTFSRDGKSGKKFTCKAGDMIIWSVMIVHGSEKNLSDKSRMTYMNGFAKADSAPDWPMYLTNGKTNVNNN